MRCANSCRTAMLLFARMQRCVAVGTAQRRGDDQHERQCEHGTDRRLSDAFDNNAHAASPFGRRETSDRRPAYRGALIGKHLRRIYHQVWLDTQFILLPPFSPLLQWTRFLYSPHCASWDPLPLQFLKVIPTYKFCSWGKCFIFEWPRHAVVIVARMVDGLFITMIEWLTSIAVHCLLKTNEHTSTAIWIQRRKRTTPIEKVSP